MRIVDLSEMIEIRTREVAEVILSYAHSLWGRGERLDRLILSGGGANIFSSYFSGYPNLHIPVRTVALECSRLFEACAEDEVVMPRKRITYRSIRITPATKRSWIFFRDSRGERGRRSSRRFCSTLWRNKMNRARAKSTNAGYCERSRTLSTRKRL